MGKAAEGLRNAWDIVDIWESYVGSREDFVDETDLIYRGVLQRAHERYCQNFKEQEILRKDEYFIKAVAAAFARMPIVETLEIYDFDIEGSWRTYSRSLIDQVSDKEDLVALTASVQRLKQFKLRSQEVRPRTFWPPVPEAEVEHVKTFLRALLDTPSLEDLSLDFTFLWDYDNMPSSTSLGSIFTFRSWTKLHNLFWRICPLHLEEFKQFISNLPASIEFISPYATHLLSGNWAEALDVLRGKARYTTIEYPSGGELEGMPKEDREDIFLRQRGRRDSDSKAEQYIAGRIEQNPLREAPVLASEPGEVSGDVEVLTAAEV